MIKKIPLLPLLAIFSMAASAQKLALPTKGICAHRGGLDNVPENTLPAFRHALSYGVQSIEFDVHFSKDSVLVIMHDDSLSRTTNGRGRVDEYTLAQLKQLDAGVKKGNQWKGTQIPTLEETLAIMPKNIWLNCHLKGEYELGRKVALFIKQHHREDQTFLTGSEDAARGARSVVPDIMICDADNIYRHDIQKYVNSTIALKAEFIQLRDMDGQDLVTPIKQLKAHGVRVNYFYAKKNEELALFFNSGVNFVLVNDVPRFMKEALKLGIKPWKYLY